MYLPRGIYAVVLTCIARNVLAAPLPQLAGVGAGCDSILSSTDNGVGYGVENAEDNTAGLITTVKGGVPGVPAVPGAKRQLAGEGAACNSVFTDTDNGVGYGVKNAETNTANLIASRPGVPAVPAVPGFPDAPGKRRRQLDKIADGAGAIGNAAGVGGVTGPFVGQADTIDGQSTSDAATAGQQVGDDEAATLENVGGLVP